MRAAERGLQLLEAVRCATGGGPAPCDDWRRTIFAQFHDYVTGSSIHEVYAEGGAELAAIAERCVQTAARDLSGRGNAPALFNPLPRPRLVLRAAGADGLIGTAMLPPLTRAPLADLPAGPAVAPVKATSRRLDNGRLRADFDAFGRIRALSVDGRQVPVAAPLGELVIHSDRPALFEAWDIDRPAMALGKPVRSRAAIEVMQTGGTSATLVCQRSLGEAGEATIRYTLEAGAPVLRIGVDVEWRRPEAMLKMTFPTACRGTHARFAAPFGSVLRRQVPGDLASEAQWEVPASRWAAVSDDAERDGLFVVTKDKYGFSCRDGTLGLTLLRSAAITCEGADTHARASHPPTLRRTQAPAKFSDLGSHRIELAVGRHDAAAPRDEQPAAWADLLYQTPVVCRGVARSAGFLGLEGGETLQPVWAMPLGRGRWILRLNETLGQRGSARLRLAGGWRARRVDLRGRPAGPARDLKTLSFGPYALVSVLIERIR
jgi:alpha-mannosidase